MFNDTITLFNRYTNKNTGTFWYPHIIHNVELNRDKASIMAKYGAESKDSASLHIPYMIVNDVITIDEIPFISPKIWARQANDKLPDLVTLNDNSVTFDFFIEGEYESTDVIADDDFEDGFYNHMNSKYDYCYAITSVGFYKTIPHFEIMAR